MSRRLGHDAPGGLDDSMAGMSFLIVGSGASAATVMRMKQAQARFVLAAMPAARTSIVASTSIPTR